MDQDKLINITIVSQIAAQLANAQAQREGITNVRTSEIIDKSIELYDILNERI